MQARSIAALCLFTGAFFYATAQAGSFIAGVNISEDVAPDETGLRVYPGATLVGKKKGDGGDSANVQFAFGDYGMKVVVAKLRTTDSPDKVAAFYRGELANFGDVLDCGKPGDASAKRAREKNSKVLTCDNDKPRKSGMLYKAGRKHDQHVVEIKPAGDGSEFSLVHVQIRSPD